MLRIPILLFSVMMLYSQTVKKVELLHSDELVSGIRNGKQVRILVGNVALKHENTTLYCDSAYQYTDENVVETFGNVRVNSDDGTSITANYIYYDADKHLLLLKGTPAILIKENSTLKAPIFSYNTKTKIAKYYENGEIFTNKTNLKSKSAVYYTKQDSAIFYENVNVVGEDFDLHARKLAFFPKKNKTVFLDTTFIHIKDYGDLIVQKGYFLSSTSELFAYDGVYYEDSSGTLSSDTLFYNDSLKAGFAKCDVRIWKGDSAVFIYGNFAEWKNDTSYFLQMTQDPFMLMFSEDDTTSLVADTLIAFGKDSIETLIAIKNVKTYNTDLQSLSDSLVYFRTKNLLVLYKNPVLWSNNYQLSADTIFIWQKDNSPDFLFATHKVFAIQHDSLDNFNQVKAKYLYAKFWSNMINYMKFVKNCEVIYFVKDKEKYIGFNYSLAKKLRMDFSDNKPEKVVLLGEPSGTFYPYYYKEQDPTLTFLGGFKWLVDKRPEKLF